MINYVSGGDESSYGKDECSRSGHNKAHSSATCLSLLGCHQSEV